MQMNNAAMLVVDRRFGRGSLSVGTDIVPTNSEENERDLMRSDNEVISKLMNYIEQHEDYMSNRNTSIKSYWIDQQQKYIEND